MTEARPSTAAALATLVGGRLEGPGDLPVTGVGTLDDATDTQATFVSSSAHAKRLDGCRARVVLASESVDLGTGANGRAVIRVRDAEIALIPLLESFAPAPERPAPGVHAQAVVDASAVVHPSASVAAFVTIGARSRIDAGALLHSGVHIESDVVIGEACELHANTVVRARCRLGRRVVLHPSCVIGSEGFGYRPAPDGRGLRRVPHLGGVRIDDDVEIGAGTCVDRAKFGDTVVGAGTKIDNLCQVGHNVRIGRSCVIAGLTGIAGSAVIGDGVRIGGQTGVADHVRIGNGAMLAGTSAVMGDVPDGAVWGGVPAQDARAALREAAAVRRLPELTRQLRHLLEGKST